MDYNYNNNNYNNNYGGYPNNNQYNNQYGSYNSNYDMPHDERKGGGFAIASFVLALVNIVPCCTCLSFITIPLCIIFSIISLAQKRKGTAFAIIGIVLSLLAGIFFAYYGFIMYKIMPDAMYFVQNQQQITDDFDRDGTIPERFEKYRDPKYDKYWERSGYKDFDEFFKYEIIEKNRKNLTGYSSGSSSSRTSSSNISDAALVFRPVFT